MPVVHMSTIPFISKPGQASARPFLKFKRLPLLFPQDVTHCFSRKDVNFPQDKKKKKNLLTLTSLLT